MKHISIAIDGPSGAGKSTLAKQLAEALGYLYVDTGAIYRTVGLAVLRRGLMPSDRAQVSAILEQLTIESGYGEDGLQHMYLDGEDVTEEIRRHEVSGYASAVSAIPEVRAFLLDHQRRFAASNNVIMDGRDIGTVVLPDADVKIYLTASPETRAQRRYQELLERGQITDYETVLRDVVCRDEADMHRSVAPLRQAEDAILVDTTAYDLKESYELILKAIRERLQA